MLERSRIFSLGLLSAVLLLSCSSPSLQRTGQVSGTVRYEDRIYGLNGFTGYPVVPKPVRFAEIDVVETGSGHILASGALDSQGSFTLPYALPSNSTAYLRVSAKTAPSAASSVEVTDLSGNIYAVTQPIGSDIVATHNIVISASSPTGGIGEAFNILDVLTAGAEFVHHLAPSLVQSPISASWEWNGMSGTYYQPGGWITVLGNYNEDTDGYDDDVIWHEYGHFAADNFSLLQSPFSQHSLNDNTQDLRLSWSEGWADFFPLAVKTWLAQNNSSTLSSQGIPYSVYVDTALVDTASLNWSFDFASPPSGTGYYYASSETAVAKILWDISGSPSLGVQAAWDVFASMRGLPVSARVNLEAFWDRWLSLRTPGPVEQSALTAIFAGRGVFYIEDSSESDDDAGAAVAMPVPSAKDHYLYKSNGTPDRDVATFVVTPADVLSNKVFSIFTDNLANGADTYITLYDSSFQKITGMENDNNPAFAWSTPSPPNDAMTLSSLLTFTASVSGTYFIEVASSPNATVSAGRYGSYTLNIQ